MGLLQTMHTRGPEVSSSIKREAEWQRQDQALRMRLGVRVQNQASRMRPSVKDEARC